MSVKNNLTLDQAEIALSYVNQDDRETWVLMAMAMKNEFGENGFDAWDRWSSQSSLYKQKDAKSVWKSVKISGRTTIGTLINEAKNNGYKYESEKNIISDDEINARRIAREKAIAEDEAKTARLHQQAQAHAQKLWQEAKSAHEHPYLTRKQIKSYGIRVGKWEAIDEDGKVWATVDNALLIPIKDSDRNLVSLQAIFPDDKNKLKRDKDFIKGGKKSGCFHSFGTPPKDGSRTRIVIGEGYATMASVHTATGYVCVVAFDAGNIPVVASIVRNKFPDAYIVIAADNDRNNPAHVGNTGLKAAQKAALEINAKIALPEFSHEQIDLTDFNDLHVRQGIEAVAKTIESAFNFDSSTDNAPIDIAVDDYAFYADNIYVANDDVHDIGQFVDIELLPHTESPELLPAPSKPVNDLPFKILGHNDGEFYFMPRESGQIKSLTAASITENALMSIAPMQFWQVRFPSKTSFDKSEAVDWIFRTAYRNGVFNPDRIRGRGCWRDDNRIVVHLGDRLHVNGSYCEIHDLDSRYIYQSERPFPRFDDVQAMTDEEGVKLLELASMFRWSIPASALLLSGWCFLAPICGALKWRPHIWLTGGAGSGKSTIINEFVYPLMSMSLFAQGNSTEAGLRQNIKGDAIPVLFEEAEQNNEREQRSMQSVLALVRQSSSESGARTLKGTAAGAGLTYHIRSMFCLASIQVGIQQQADRERLTILQLREKESVTANEVNNWADIQNGLYELSRNKDTAKKMLKRTVDMLPTLLKSIAVFIDVAAEHFGNQRTGDQYGTLLAGLWCLVNNTAPTKEQAKSLIQSTDWNDYTSMKKGSDSEMAMSTFLSAKLRSAGGLEFTVFELLDAIADQYDIVRSSQSEPSCKLNTQEINGLFARYGMKYDHEERALLIANNHDGIEQLMRGTQYAADIRGNLLRSKSVKKIAKSKRFGGIVSKSIAIDIAEIVN
jgi:putative DNA primase/helicase